MKTRKDIKESIQQKLFKKTVDGILMVAIRMFDAQSDVDNARTFLLHLVNDTPEAFYARPIIPAKEVNTDVHD